MTTEQTQANQSFLEKNKLLIGLGILAIILLLFKDKIITLFGGSNNMPASKIGSDTAATLELPKDNKYVSGATIQKRISGNYGKYKKIMNVPYNEAPESKRHQYDEMMIAIRKLFGGKTEADGLDYTAEAVLAFLRGMDLSVTPQTLFDFESEISDYLVNENKKYGWDIETGSFLK